MKKLLIILPLALLFACGQDSATSDNLSALKAEKDSLKTVYKQLGARIAEIDAIIQENDTTKKLTQVSTLTVEKGTFNHFLEVYGNVEASESVSLYPEMNGKIKSIKVEEGQEVRKGQLLISLDSDVLVGNLKELETNLELASTLFEKQEKLWKQNIGSEVQYLEAKARKESLESSKKALLAQIEMTEIRAPFSGIIDEIFPKVGELGGPQMPAVRLLNMNDVYIKANVSESYLPYIKKGTYAEVEFDALNETLDSKVIQVGRFINPNNRTFKVKIAVPATDYTVNPNLLARVKVKDFEVVDSAITIPTRMIQQTPKGEDYVMLLESGNNTTVKKRMIRTSVSYAGNTLVIEGLDDGEQLIDKGARSVKDGQEVAVK